MRTHREILEAGVTCHNAGDYARACELFDKLLGYTDEFDPALLCCYGAALSANGQHGVASWLLRQVLLHVPDFGAAWYNLGTALFHLDRDEACIFAYEKALELLPKDADVLGNVAAFYINKGQPQKIVEYARRALEIDPKHVQANNNLAQGLLELGRFDEAWPHFEYRWELPDKIKNKRPYTCPKWTGEYVGTLAVHGEQGVGDEVLFMAAFSRLHGRVGRVIVECVDRLIPAFERSFGVKCYPDHAALIAAEGEPDAHIAMGSLWSILGLPDGTPYLAPPFAKPKNERPRIGIAWRGGSWKTHKRARAMKLAQWAPILTTRGVDFVSVNYDDGIALQEAEKHGIECAVKSRDIEEAIAAIWSCDLVITVCQTAVHLAGAMGVPCWVLTPKRAAWRYTGEGEQSRWYNSVRLFRQDDSEAWEPVVQRIAHELRSRFA